jgi:hypothetical protein
MRNLTAVCFEKAMTSGRTRPLVLACEEVDEESGGPTVMGDGGSETTYGSTPPPREAGRPTPRGKPSCGRPF